jgi:hypothetical protein
VVPGRESGKWTTVLGWAVAKWVGGEKKEKKGSGPAGLRAGKGNGKKKEEEWAAC